MSDGSSYIPLINQAAQQYGLDPNIFLRQLTQESQLDPNAVNKKSGAAGIAQFMPKTAADFGIDPFDPQQAIPAAAQFMHQNLKRFGGDYSKALAAYNWGPENVHKYGLTNAPPETQDYIDRIMGGGDQQQPQPNTPPPQFAGFTSSDVTLGGDAPSDKPPPQFEGFTLSDISLPPGQPEPETSTFGAIGHAFEREAVPAAGGMVGFGAGASVGAPIGGLIGLAGGPFAPVTVPAGEAVGGLIGGLGGALGGSELARQAQSWVASQFPDSVKQFFGQDTAQQQADIRHHPYASFVGALAPNLFMMRPGFKSLPPWEEGTPLWQRVFAHPMTARAAGAGIVGGQEALNEAGPGLDISQVDPTKVAIAAGAGALMNRP